MRSDCEMKCYIDLVIKECQLNCIFLWHNDKLIREELAGLYLGLRMCDYKIFNITTRIRIHEKQAQSSKSFCEGECPKSCYETIYDYQVKEEIGGAPDSQFGV